MTGRLVVPTLVASPMKYQAVGRFRAASCESRASERRSESDRRSHGVWSGIVSVDHAVWRSSVRQCRLHMHDCCSRVGVHPPTATICIDGCNRPASGNRSRVTCAVPAARRTPVRRHCAPTGGLAMKKPPLRGATPAVSPLVLANRGAEALRLGRFKEMSSCLAVIRKPTSILLQTTPVQLSFTAISSCIWTTDSRRSLTMKSRPDRSRL